MVEHFRARVLGVLCLVAAAAAVLVAIPEDTDAGTYWALGADANAVAAGPPQTSTNIGVTNWGTTDQLVTLYSGVGVPVQGPIPVAAKSSGLLNFNDQILGTQITYQGVYYVDAPGDFEANQLTTVYGASATTDGSRLLEENDLGDYYVIGSWDDPGNGYVCIGTCVNFDQGAEFITVIAIKEGTQVTVTVTGATAPSPGCPANPCAAPGQVPALAAGGSFTTTLARGQALQIESRSVYSTTCITMLGAGCVSAPLAGSQVSASSPVVVFAGATCVNMQDTSCDLIYDQVLPENTAGKVYVVCSQSQDLVYSGPARAITPPTLVWLVAPANPNLEMMRIRSVSGTAFVTFSSPTVGPGPIVSAAAVTTGWSTFYYNQDLVVRSNANIQVVNYMASLNTEPASGGNDPAGDPVGYAYYRGQNYGDPSMASMRSFEAGSADHWFYTHASWESYMVVASKLGASIKLDNVAMTGQRAIAGDTEFGCTPTLLDLASGTGATHHLTSDFGDITTAQVLGLGFATSYLYDLGGTPIIISPPEGPDAVFKPRTPSTACGPRPVQFQDQSTSGDAAITTWDWMFGDGTTSTEQNPTHLYASPGEYDVFETVTDANGLTSSYYLKVTATDGGPCSGPTDPQDDGMAPRAPRDGVDAGLAEGDDDFDRVVNAFDNCPTTANADQLDTDTDTVGDACDLDLDGDRVLNVSDNCVDLPNTSQADMDGDAVGDVCDGDIDGDTLANALDNCPSASNLDQVDEDGDGTGDVCDAVSTQANAGPGASSPTENGIAQLATAVMESRLGFMLIVAGIAAVVVGSVLVVTILRRRS